MRRLLGVHLGSFLFVVLFVCTEAGHEGLLHLLFELLLQDLNTLHQKDLVSSEDSNASRNYTGNYTDISSAINDDNSLFRSLEDLEEARKQRDHFKVEFSTEEDTNRHAFEGFSWKCLSCRGSVEVLK